MSGRGQVRIKVDNVIEEVERRVPAEAIEIQAAVFDEETEELLEAAVFEPPEGAKQDEQTGEFFFDEIEEELVFQEVSIKYHAWDEWTHGFAPKWDGVPWVDYFAMMDKESFAK